MTASASEGAVSIGIVAQDDQVRTGLNPWLRYRLPTHEYNDGRFTRRLDRLDEVKLRANEPEIREVDMLSGSRVSSRRPEEGLVQRPCANHYNRHI